MITLAFTKRELEELYTLDELEKNPSFSLKEREKIMGMTNKIIIPSLLEEQLCEFMKRFMNENIELYRSPFADKGDEVAFIYELEDDKELTGLVSDFVREYVEAVREKVRIFEEPYVVYKLGYAIFPDSDKEDFIGFGPLLG